MEYTRLGSSGLKISRVAMGTMSFGEGDSGREGWPIPYEDAVPFFRQALDLGITFWDTANGYNAGTSEEAVGRALKEFTRRDDIVVATKVYFPVRDGPGGSGLSRKAIMEQIDASLSRLGTDYVDLYQIHRFDPETPVEETMEALHDVVKAGKARPGSRSDRNIPSRRCCVRFSYRMVPEVYQVFWAGMAAGEFINDAAIAAGSYRKQGSRWLAAAGGVRPRRGRGLRGRCLTLAQREEIALGRARGDSIRAIAALLGRSPSTVSRELRRNADGLGRYRATTAHALAYHRASRPKPGKLVQNLELRGKVEADLAKKYSPEQIAGRLKVEFPDQPEMQVSTETIYQSLYVQSRGALKRDLTRCLRTGRAVRRPSRKVGQRKNRIPNMINIAERPAEAEDRAVPGHWEGDLIIGRKNLSAIGTLVERTTNYTMLLHLPDGYTPELVRDALAAKIKTLPEALRASLTWDQGPEMGKWKQVAVDADIDIFFCDPHAPWQRATNENTNGLLRQYFPKSSDLSAHSADDLDWVAAELNDRPRKRLGFKKPVEQIGPLLLR